MKRKLSALLVLFAVLAFTCSGAFAAVSDTNTFHIHYDFEPGTVGESYSEWVSGWNGTEPYTWSYTGTLPPGLSLRPSSSIGQRLYYLEGTPTQTGRYSFTVTVRDSNGLMATKRFTVVITGDSSSGEDNDFEIEYSFADGAVDVGYSDYVKADGTAPYSWTYSGTLPPGLSLTPNSDGERAYLTGRPTTAGTYNFSLTATDSNGDRSTKSFTVNINPELTLTGTLPNGTVGTSYSGRLTASGGAGSYNWAITEGTLPAGLRATSSDSGFTISGTPTTTGTYTFRVGVSVRQTYYEMSAAAITKTVSRLFTVTISSSDSTPIPTPTPSGITITGNSSSSGTLNSSYSSSYSVSGGTAPYTWAVSSGTLPAGLTLSSSGSSATISGTPTQSGTYNVVLRVTDGSGSVQTQNVAITINGGSSDNLYIDYTFVDGIVGLSYRDVVVAKGTSPYTWEYSSNNGTPPDGLTLYGSGTNNTGNAIYLSGTPTTAGTNTFQLRVTDGNGETATKTFTVNINQDSSVTGTVPNGQVGAQYFATLNASGGIGAYTWSISQGSLPAGLTSNGSGSAFNISGTPQAAGTYSFTVALAYNRQVYDESMKTLTRTLSKNYTIVVADANQTVQGNTQGNEGITENYNNTVTREGDNNTYNIDMGDDTPQFDISKSNSYTTNVSGGCSAGFGLLALMALALVLKRSL